jgi:hypothetical protein
MADNLDGRVMETIEAAKLSLRDQKARIDKLRKAGEDVTELDRQYQATKQRVDRWERAFKL